MKKIIFFTFCACFAFSTLTAQNADTYQIEKLDRAQVALDMLAPSYLFENIEGKEFVKYSHSEPLVRKGMHPVISGYLQAYQEHRPVTLSPDIVWLLICQGFAQHVNNNAEELRHKFVDFEGQETLGVVREVSKETTLQTFSWETVFPEFIEKVKHHVGEDLIGTLTADFTTTTPASLIASQITIMDVVENYFKYSVGIMSCGIPEVTIEGSLEDWKKIMERLDVLEKYELKWWTKELRPIIKEIIKAKSGKFNPKFWKEMIRCHKENECAPLEDIDGWFLKFYPYLANGKRFTVKSIKNVSVLPDEIVSIPFELEMKIDENSLGVKSKMEFWAGFIGLSQDTLTYSLKPEIGWAVCAVAEIDE